MHKNNIMIIAFLIFFSTRQSVICPSMSTMALTQDNDAVIRSVTSNLLCPIRIFDASRGEERQEQSRPEVDFEVHVLADRCDHSIGKFDLTARLRLIRQNDWHGLARVNQTQRTFRWSGIKRIMISVGRHRDRSAIPFVVSLRYDVRIPQVLVPLPHILMRLDGSKHPAGEEIPASKLPDQTARKLYCEDFPPAYNGL